MYKGATVRQLLLAMLIALCGAYPHASGGSYLFMWAGDAARAASDFLAVIDASPASPRYGRSSSHRLRPARRAPHPHITPSMRCQPTGTCWRTAFTRDARGCSTCRQPLTSDAFITSFGDVAGFSHPHSFIRLANGRVLATFQYRAQLAGQTGQRTRDDAARRRSLDRRPRGDGRTRAVPSDPPAPSDPAIKDRSDLSVQRAADAGLRSRGLDNHRHGRSEQGGDVGVGAVLATVAISRCGGASPCRRALAATNTSSPASRACCPMDSSVYIHTFNCGLYLLRGVRTVPTRKRAFVTAFQGKNCGVACPDRSLLDCRPCRTRTRSLPSTSPNPERPREVSTLAVGEDEEPHWISIDSAGRRIVLNSSGGGRRATGCSSSTSTLPMDGFRSTSGFATRAAHGPASGLTGKSLAARIHRKRPFRTGRSSRAEGLPPISAQVRALMAASPRSRDGSGIRRDP